MAEKFHVTNMKAKVVEPPKEGGRQGAVDAWNTARNAPAPPPLPDQTLINNFRSDRYSTFNAKKRKALADAGLSEDYGTFSSGEPYQPPMAPGEIVSDMGSLGGSETGMAVKKSMTGHGGRYQWLSTLAPRPSPLAPAS